MARIHLYTGRYVHTTARRFASDERSWLFPELTEPDAQGARWPRHPHDIVEAVQARVLLPDVLRGRARPLQVFTQAPCVLQAVGELIAHRALDAQAALVVLMEQSAEHTEPVPRAFGFTAEGELDADWPAHWFDWR